MSGESIELLRRSYGRWARGEFWTPEIFDPDVEIEWAAEIPDVHKARGLAGVERTVREWLAAWEDMRMQADEFVDLDDGRVLVLVSVRGRGKGSGVMLHEDDYAHIWTMRDGRATKIVGYATRAAALRDAGLAR